MRRFWINTHLYLAALLAPVFFLVAVSGGLYLIGIKGTIEQTPVVIDSAATLDSSSASLEADIKALLSGAGVEHDFEYIKDRGDTLQTRPTSRTHYEFQLQPDGLKVFKNEPDLQKRMIELHMGHGPLWFKEFQKIAALGLLLVVASGLWLGLSAPGLRVKTLASSITGLVVFVGLVLFA